MIETTLKVQRRNKIMLIESIMIDSLGMIGLIVMSFGNEGICGRGFVIGFQ